MFARSSHPGIPAGQGLCWIEDRRESWEGAVLSGAGFGGGIDGREEVYCWVAM